MKFSSSLRVTSLCLVLCIGVHVGCSSEDTPAVSPGDASTGTEDASTGGSDAPTGTEGDASTTETGADASTNDAATDTGSETSSDAGGCQTGGLTAPAAGKVSMEITYSNPQGGYNGATAPFSGTSAGLAATSDPSFWYFAHGDLRVTVPANPTVCQIYTTTAVPSVDPARLQLGAGAKQWWCGGTVVVDSINGKETQFHFDAHCEAPSFIGQQGAGTVNITGKGSGTFF